VTAAVERLPELSVEHRAFLWSPGQAPLHLLYSHQREVVAEFHATDATEFVFECGRRFGKTAVMVWLAIAFCMRQPNVNVLYVAPTAKQLRRIVRPHLARYLADCPVSIRPEPRWQDNEIRFQNGSVIYLSGTENQNAESLRGIETHLALIDEPGSMADLEYLVEDIISPQTLTTDGRIILGGTPPPQPAHDFARIYVPRARIGNDSVLVQRTVHHAKHIKPETIERLCRKAGGEDSATWRREYLAQDVYDSESSVLPEFDRHKDAIIEARERPPWSFKWVSGDIGFVDLSFWLFAYVDFKHAVVVIEDELVVSGKATSDQVPMLRAKERDLWGPMDREPFRYVDASELVRAEFPKTDGGYSVGPADNRDLDATVNALRIGTQRLRYRINPKCRQLIAHCRNATWNKQRTGFERVEGFGHFDGVAALMYLMKHANIQMNPYPSLPAEATTQDWVIPAPKQPMGAGGSGVSLKRRRRAA
jgi:hypothetical protein